MRFFKKIILASLLSLCMICASAVHADPLKKMAKVLARGMGNLENKKIAILPFPYHDGAMSSGSTIVSERLTTYLVGKYEVEVIERSLLNKVLEEMKLGETGVVDQETTKEIGNILGVEAVVTGTLIDLPKNKTEVNARLIQTETGKILSAYNKKIKRTWKDEPVKKTAKKRKVRRKKPAKVPAPAAKPEPPQRFEEKPMDVDRIEIDGIRTPRFPPPGNIREARQRFKHARNPRDKARALMRIGHIHEREGRIRKARAIYRRIINDFPGQREIVRHAKQRLKHLRQ